MRNRTKPTPPIGRLPVFFYFCHRKFTSITSLGDQSGKATNVATAQFGGAPCILTIVIVSAIALLILVTLCFAIYHYKSDSTFVIPLGIFCLDDRLRSQLQRERQNLQKTDDYYRTRLRERSAKEKEREKTFVELINESNKAREQLREEQLEQLKQQNNHTIPTGPLQPQILPIVIPANPLQNGQLGDQRRLTDVVGELRGLREELTKNRDLEDTETGRGIEHGNGELPQNFGARSGRSIRIGGISVFRFKFISGTNKGSPNLVESDYDYDQDPEESVDDSKTDRPSHLPHDHPGTFLEISESSVFSSSIASGRRFTSR